MIRLSGLAYKQDKKIIRKNVDLFVNKKVVD